LRPERDLTAYAGGRARAVLPAVRIDRRELPPVGLHRGAVRDERAVVPVREVVTVVTYHRLCARAPRPAPLALVKERAEHRCLRVRAGEEEPLFHKLKQASVYQAHIVG